MEFMNNAIQVPDVRKQEECIVFLDVLEKAGEGTYNAYVDFRTIKDLTLFRELNQEVNANFGETNTYILLRSVRSSKRLLRGCYYRLNMELLLVSQYQQAEDSFFVSRIYDLGNMQEPEGEEAEVLQSHEPLDPEDLFVNHANNNMVLTEVVNNNLNLVVRDVGQANWNELLDGDQIKVVYDLGAKLQATKAEVQCLYERRRQDLERDKPLLVLSHWDMDHIHCLRYLSEEDIKKAFSGCICVDKMKSLTSSRIYGRLVSALGAANVSCPQPPARTDGIAMHLWRSSGNLFFYQGENGRNINYSGMCMFVRGLQKSAALTGDVKLIQAKSMYDAEIQKGDLSAQHVLVAPHHGGDNEASNRVYSTPTTEVMISVGANNSYGHPDKYMLKFLTRLCHNNVKRTDENGDIFTSL